MKLKDVIDEMEHWNGVEPQPMVAVNRWISSLRQESERREVALTWHEGPARGGEGTAGKDKNGTPLWCDGELLLVVVYLDDGDREISVVSIAADEDYFDIRDVYGNSWGWQDTDIEWWAKLDITQLPSRKEKEKATT